MANQLYGYRPTSTYLTGANSRSTVSDYISGDGIASRYLSGDLLASSSSVLYDPHNYSIAPTHLYRPPGVDDGSDLASSTDPLYAALKRNSSDSLYHQTLLGAYNKIGQTEAWHPTDPLAKRTRYESTSLLPTYPQRPGEKGCAFYMQTRTCKFGESCKFDHPIWVPEGGFPDWKEVPPVSSEYLPERPGEPDCPYFLKTQKCKFGVRCKFNHPRDKIEPPGASVVSDASSLPERPSEPPCAFYMKTGKCKYGANCKFHHPKGVQIQLAGGESELQTKPIGGTITKTAQPSITPVLSYNTKGLPIRTGEEDCPFYLKTGSCKYGVTCRFSHPERYASAIGSSALSAYFNLGVASSAASLLSTYDPRPSQTTIGVGANVYPQRPGQTECDYYMKNGICKFGDNCKFHHPIDRSAHTSSTKDAHPQQQNVKLTLAGLPRREGAIHCPYYMKTGTCKFGSTCKFDHPPPAEAMALAAAANSNTATVEGDQQNVPDAS